MKLIDFAPWRLGLHWTAQGTGAHDEFSLSSHFQAIFSADERRPVAYEALLRATRADGLVLDPAQLLKGISDDATRARLDRQSRRVQVEKFLGLGDPRSRLFLNLDPYVAVEAPRYGSFFADILRSHGLPAYRVAVELTESPVRDESRLAAAVEYYRELGCLVVIDDFGAGHSNFDRIWRLAPDIVKIDREMTRQVTSNPIARRMFAGIVSVLHDAGASVCVEGVETEDQALCAIDAGADLLQGYYLSRPGEKLVADEACRDLFDHLREVSARRSEAAAAVASTATSSAAPHSISRRSRNLLRHARSAGNVIRFRRRFTVVRA